MNRRDFLTILAQSFWTFNFQCIQANTEKKSIPVELSSNKIESKMKTIVQREILSSKEKIPAIGIGTWQTFDISSNTKEFQNLSKVLAEFYKMGGTVIDSSPMYRRAESIVGELNQQFQMYKPFLATKVWTTGETEGKRQIENSFQKFQTETIDLFQVHNLVDYKVQLKNLRKLKDKGKIRYIGITHYTTSSFNEIERVMKEEPLDFIQIPYSIVLRDAEKRLYPLALEKKISVIVNRPFEQGSLFSSLKSRELPNFAKENGCTSWAGLFLKFILSHPAVTIVIPATTKVKHLIENMEAGFGNLWDIKTREKIGKLIYE